MYMQIDSHNLIIPYASIEWVEGLRDDCDVAPDAVSGRIVVQTRNQEVNFHTSNLLLALAQFAGGLANNSPCRYKEEKEEVEKMESVLSGP